MKKLTVILVFCMSISATAGDLNWSGRYRVEGNFIKNQGLASDGQSELSYLNHHLVLMPEMIAADGLVIHSRFDIFNNDTANSQLGRFFGSTGDNGSGISGIMDNTVVSGTADEQTSYFNVTQLYLSWVNEYSQLLAGRIPVHFGLGLHHNAGDGEFDHWIDTKDILGAKVVAGNFTFMPMFGKVYEGSLTNDDDIRDLTVLMNYQNMESGLSMGFSYQSRTSGSAGVNIDTSNLANMPYHVPPGGSGLTGSTTSLSIKDYSLFVKRNFTDFNFALEAAIQDGDTGIEVNTAGGNQQVSLGGFALAAEANYKAGGSKWDWNLKLGSISGDNPNTAEDEGYYVDRNYNLGLLLFNYGFGQADILGTASRKTAYVAAKDRNTDTEYLTNAIYVSPAFNWAWTDRWTLNGRVVYAQLNEVFANSGQGDEALGTEVDLGVTYSPHERLQLKSDLGLLFPGAAFQAGANNLPTEMAWGLVTKLAVSF